MAWYSAWLEQGAYPRTGAAILYLNASHTDRIVELDPEQSETLIQQLFTHLYAIENRYEHRWNKGNFIVWDNLGCQHARPAITFGMTRTLSAHHHGTAFQHGFDAPRAIGRIPIRRRCSMNGFERYGRAG